MVDNDNSIFVVREYTFSLLLTLAIEVLFNNSSFLPSSKELVDLKITFDNFDDFLDLFFP